MEQSGIAIWYHIVTVGALVVFKLAVLFVGYLFAKLGHNLLITGVSGEFKFKAEMNGVRADLISASPGIFFILMATILIAVGIIKDKPFETLVTARQIKSQGERIIEKSDSLNKPTLP